MEFKTRLSAPSKTDKNWLHTSVNGLNECILIADGSVLPNCVGYAWGRFLEILGTKPELSVNNAENCYAHKDSYKRGQEPKLGAVMCWQKGATTKGKDGAGHVACVEKIDADGTVTLSNSDADGRRFYTSTLKKPYNLGKGFTYQGSIYNPAVADVVVDPTPVEIVLPCTHKIKKGETLSAIAMIYYGHNEAKYYNFIANVNKISNPNIIKTGRVLNITEYVERSVGLTVGDKVQIINYGNASSNGNSAKASGINYKREILKVWAGRRYPYQVGNNSGTLGFYKADALKKI